LELNYKLVGVRIKATRLAKALTQEELAERASISPQHVSHVENGGTKLSLPCLVAICNALDVTADKILMDSIPQAEIHYVEEVAKIFDNCSSDEMFLMLSVAESLKKALRFKE
jgi:transcriptional regulator with XRE-family HTH domain